MIRLPDVGDGFLQAVMVDPRPGSRLDKKSAGPQTRLDAQVG